VKNVFIYLVRSLVVTRELEKYVDTSLKWHRIPWLKLVLECAASDCSGLHCQRPDSENLTNSSLKVEAVGPEVGYFNLNSPPVYQRKVLK
jgi:hypothetical protein